MFKKETGLTRKEAIKIALTQMRSPNATPSMEFLHQVWIWTTANPYIEDARRYYHSREEMRELKKEFWDKILFETWEDAAKNWKYDVFGRIEEVNILKKYFNFLEM